MSGIFGILHLDVSEILSADVNAMARQLERRGPDRTHCWQDGNVALGHTLLATTPEALVEVLPLTDPDSGCTITADVRLDNRDELIAQLGLHGVERVIGDGELILKAYLRWGEDCPNKLLGDFAFAIWDPGRQHLFCARDHMGMRQLIYHYQPGKLFVFATEVEAVIAHSGVPQVINEGRIADFLDDLEGVDLTSTFFEGVSRLAPAQCMTLGSGVLTTRRFWRLTPPRQLRLQSDDAYGAAFRKILSKAVHSRLRSPSPMGAMLSGGMDSGSVAAEAAKLLGEQGRGPLHTFSAIRSDPMDCPECEAIQRSSSTAGVVPHFVDDEAAAADPRQPELVRALAEPFDGHMTMARAVYHLAHENGVNVVLDGVSGDVILTSSNRLSRLLRQGLLRRAWKEARAAESYWKTPMAFRSMIEAAWVAFVPEAVRRPVRAAKWFGQDRTSARARLVHHDFARRISLSSRRSHYRSHARAGNLSDVERRISIIEHPHLTAARERYDRVASAFAIEPRDPFMDIRLIEFCLSLPEEQLQKDGWPKWVLRQAMRGTMPEDVIWRRGKEHVGWQFTQSLFRHWPEWRAQLLRSAPALCRFMPANKVAPAQSPNSSAISELTIETAFLAFWLERNSNSGSALVRPASGN